MSQTAAITPEDIANIRAVFPEAPEDRELVTLAYAVQLIRMARGRAGQAKQHQKLAAAIRALQDVLPGLIEGAEAEIETARSYGLPTSADRVVQLLAPLRDAAEQAAQMKPLIDSRSWWHGWASMLAIDLRATMTRQGERMGFGKPTSRGPEIIQGIFALAGVAVTPESVVKALRK